MFLFGSPLGPNYFLFGPVLGPIFKEGFDFSQFNLIFLCLIIQEIKFLVGFLHVCPHFPAFLLSLGCSARVKNISPWVTSGSPKNDQVRFGFLQTQELQVKFRVGF